MKKQNYTISEMISEEQVSKRVKELAAQIIADYRYKSPVLVGVLKGSFIFLADLIRLLPEDTEMTFVWASSYGNAADSTGTVRLNSDVDMPLKDRNVIIVEDIIDSGHTLEYLSRMLAVHKPASMRICTFLDKPTRREAVIKADYVGFEIPDEFVVGYGLDYAGKHRNLKNISKIEFKLPLNREEKD